VTIDRRKRIQEILEGAFSPVEILVKDQSHLHAGHAGARDGREHFEVRITADTFAGKSRIQRHRMVFEALGDMMQTDIHALSVHARAPDDR
jgi:stress-induced morphogen